MLYIIGGPPRCGKSELARRLTARSALSFVSTDLLWAVLEGALPEWRPPMPKGPTRIGSAARMFEPYLERAVTFLTRWEQPAGIEGEVILPETVVKLQSDHDVRAVFLIRRAATAAAVRDPRGPHPWLHSAPPELATAVAGEVASWSDELRPACDRLGLPCFDVGENFDGALASATEALGLSESPG
jgi:hypothetical protein